MRDFVSINMVAQLILQTACLIWICWKNETRYDPLLSVITILLGVYSGNKAILAWMNVNTFIGIWCALFIAQLIGGMALTIVVNEIDVLIKHLLKRELISLEANCIQSSEASCLTTTMLPAFCRDFSPTPSCRCCCS